MIRFKPSQLHAAEAVACSEVLRGSSAHLLTGVQLSYHCPVHAWLLCMHLSL